MRKYARFALCFCVVCLAFSLTCGAYSTDTQFHSTRDYIGTIKETAYDIRECFRIGAKDIDGNTIVHTNARLLELSGEQARRTRQIPIFFGFTYWEGQYFFMNDIVSGQRVVFTVTYTFDWTWSQNGSVYYTSFIREEDTTDRVPSSTHDTKENYITSDNHTVTFTYDFLWDENKQGFNALQHACTFNVLGDIIINSISVSVGFDNAPISYCGLYTYYDPWAFSYDELPNIPNINEELGIGNKVEGAGSLWENFVSSYEDIPNSAVNSVKYIVGLTFGLPVISVFVSLAVGIMFVKGFLAR